MKNLIVIDGKIVEVTEINDNYLTMEDGREYIIFEDSYEAGQAAKEYWVDMAENDKEEFICMVGADCLVSWCLGEYAGPGSTKVSSLEGWFELWENIPAEHFASYDGIEIEDISFNKNLSREIGFDSYDAVLYRSN